MSVRSTVTRSSKCIQERDVTGLATELVDFGIG